MLVFQLITLIYLPKININGRQKNTQVVYLQS